MIKMPPYLKKGDTIGIVCPSGYMPAEKAATCIRVLQEWGYQVKVGKTLGNQFHYFSGTDEERLKDLQNMLDDPSINAILCGRGGYGLSRIVDSLNFKAFRKYPKWVIGFSDITVLHAQLYRQVKTAAIHAPMAAAFNDGGAENVYVQSIRQILKGQRPVMRCAAHTLNKKGYAMGELVGGNLSLIAHLAGTPTAFTAKGRILFLEDVGEYLYNIDRMMIQLQRAGMLDGLKGLIFGGFTDMKDTVIPFGTKITALLHQHVQHKPYPVCFDFPVSHEKENYALKIGANYELKVGARLVQLQECG